MKKTIKAVAVLLAAIFCLSALVLAAGATAADVSKGDTFIFGSYPQTRVSDEALEKQLNALSEKQDKANIVTMGGLMYQKLRIEKPSNPGDGAFGTMYGYLPYRNYWFLVEPIEWLVLDKDENGVLLMAKYVLCTHTFNDAIRADNTWVNSDVRKWLNDGFLNKAFTVKEQTYLLKSSLTNEPNPIRGTYNGVESFYFGKTNHEGYEFVGNTSGGVVTQDTVFLPSFKEITNKNYGFNIYCTAYGDFYDKDKAAGCDDEYLNYYDFAGYYEQGGMSGRQASGTDFAKCQGVWANLTTEEYGMPVSTCRYWLRTAGYNSIASAAVLEDGRVSTGWNVDYDIVGIRPMVRVSLSAEADNSPFTPGNVPDQPENLPFKINAPAGDIHYLDKGVQFTAEVPVTWKSSDEDIAKIDENGNVTINGVGTVTISATSKDTGETVEFQVEITYLWWQKLIRIFLFGWLWY